MSKRELWILNHLYLSGCCKEVFEKLLHEAMTFADTHHVEDSRQAVEETP